MERLSRRSFVKIAADYMSFSSLDTRDGAPLDRMFTANVDFVYRLSSAAVPEEPLVAYVRDAKRGEVTVTSGTSERTYRDRALVQRLLRAAGKKGVS